MESNRKRKRLPPQPISCDQGANDEQVAKTPKKPKVKAKRKQRDDQEEHSPPAKKQRKAASASKVKGKGSQQEPQEERLKADGSKARFRTKPTAQIQVRIQRALPGSGHRLYLINREMIVRPGAEGGGSEQFKILGATGNVYTVDICRHRSCTCPDHQKGNLCKHILFVLLRVLQLPRDHCCVWQDALLASEVDSILRGEFGSKADGDNDQVMANKSVVKAYKRIQGGQSAGTEGEGVAQKTEGECIICFDDFNSNEELVWCKTQCGASFHKDCFKRWKSSRGGLQLTCPHCRADWPQENRAGGEYVNLANVSKEHSGADVSLRALYGESARWIRNR